MPAKLQVTVSPTSMSTTFGLQRLSLPSGAIAVDGLDGRVGAARRTGRRSNAKAAAAAIRRFT